LEAWARDCRPDGELIYPERCDRLDYEGEIAIVLGKRGVGLKPSQLKDYVWGVTMLGDRSIRAPREMAGGPLSFGFPKNFDTSCSIGPCIAVGEADPTNVDMETVVNGERRQRFNTRDMVFTFGEYLEHLSRDFTLYPGDIISGGTAAGTAADSSELLPDNTSAPERFPKPGDLVEMSSPAIGSLRTRVVASKARHTRLLVVRHRCPCDPTTPWSAGWRPSRRCRSALAIIDGKSKNSP
jgi:acylpyruvate hydrolase